MVSDRSGCSEQNSDSKTACLPAGSSAALASLANFNILMKSFEVCKSPVRPQRLVDVWLDAGREGREFSYLASAELGLQSGDLVRVRLRGRSMNGLVVGERELGSTELDGLQPVEALLKKAAVDAS